MASVKTEICERGVRRLARSRNVTIARQGDLWTYNGVELDSDDMWAILSAMPATNATPFGRL